MAKTYIKGNAVANATSYELFEKASGGTYNSLASKNEINFELDGLGLAEGDHTLVVKAKASGYEDSDYSNEVVYTVEDNSPKETTWYVDYTSLGGNFNYPNSSGAAAFANPTTYEKCIGVPINALKVIPGGAGDIGYGVVAADGDTYTHKGTVTIPASDVATAGTADAAKVYELEEIITLSAGERLAVMEYDSVYTGKIFVSTNSSEDLAKVRTNIRSAGASKDEGWKLPIGIGYIV